MEWPFVLSSSKHRIPFFTSLLRSQNHRGDAWKAADNRPATAGFVHLKDLAVSRRYQYSFAVRSGADIHDPPAHVFREHLPVGAGIVGFVDGAVGPAVASPRARTISGNPHVDQPVLVFGQRVAVGSPSQWAARSVLRKIPSPQAVTTRPSVFLEGNI